VDSGFTAWKEANRMNVSLKISGAAAILAYEKEHERHQHVIAGGANGVLVSIDQEGHIHVQPPGDPSSTERVREAVRQITDGAQMLGELARDAGAASTR
jgi:hypothetical protein